MTNPADFGLRLPYLLRRVNGALSQRLDRALKPYALTQAQLSALALLAHQKPGGLSGAELSHRSGVTAQSMHAALTSLETRGLVVRRAHPTHGRILETFVTDEGLSLVHEVQRQTLASKDYDAGLTPAEQQQLRSLLRKMMIELDLYLPQ